MLHKIIKQLFLSILAIIVIGGVSCFLAISFPSVEARINNNDQVVVQSSVEDNVAVHFLAAAEDTASSTVLVDLSDVTNYPHYMNAGTMEITQIRLDHSSEAAASTTLKFGVLASSTIAGDLVDIYWFDEISFSNDGATGNNHQSKILDYSPSVMKLNLSSGIPVSFLTNDSSLVDTFYATTTSLRNPNGYGAPGVGDLLMKIYNQEGTATTSVTVLYRIKE